MKKSRTVNLKKNKVFNIKRRHIVSLDSMPTSPDQYQRPAFDKLRPEEYDLDAPFAGEMSYRHVRWILEEVEKEGPIIHQYMIFHLLTAMNNHSRQGIAMEQISKIAGAILKAMTRDGLFEKNPQTWNHHITKQGKALLAQRLLKRAPTSRLWSKIPDVLNVINELNAQCEPVRIVGAWVYGDTLSKDGVAHHLHIKLEVAKRAYSPVPGQTERLAHLEACNRYIEQVGGPRHQNRHRYDALDDVKLYFAKQLQKIREVKVDFFTDLAYECHEHNMLSIFSTSQSKMAIYAKADLDVDATIQSGVIALSQARMN